MSKPMRAIPEPDRPRERLLRLGPEALSHAELIAILLGTGVPGRSALELAEELLVACQAREPGAGLLALLRLKDQELGKLLPGIGPAKRCQILAALQLGLCAKDERANRLTVNGPAAVYEFVRPRLEHLDHEQLLVIAVNAKHQVIDVECVSKGTLTTTLIHPREIFQCALRKNAWGVILAHNHPSGDPRPSREDRGATARLVEAGLLLGIHVLDHVIVGNGRYVSLRDEGLVDWS
jgi:DNA repair protein RadC